MKKFKLYEEFLNESTWYPTFKAQGEFINKKDHVTMAELEKIAHYFMSFYKMNNIQVGKIKILPDASSYTSGETVERYGVSGIRNWLSEEQFIYYWKDSSDPELSDLESGWVGKMVMKSKSPAQFMSPFQFLECVEMHYLYSHEWIEPVSKKHLEQIEREMNRLVMQSPRKVSIVSKKYGLS